MYQFSILYIEGQYLVEQILGCDDTDLAFAWNRSKSSLLGKIDEKYILEDLSLFYERYFCCKKRYDVFDQAHLR